MITSSTSDSETRTTWWPNSSTMSAAVSGSMVWFCVAMMPFCIRVLTTAATRSAMRLASSCTVIASGTCTSRTTFSRSPEWLATRRFSRSWRRFIAAIERWRPSSSVALAMVSLPERRRSSSPFGRARFSSTTGAFSPTFFGPVGRPASARAATACAAAGSTVSAAVRAAGCGFARAATRAASSACSAAAAAARCSAISRSRACALGGLLLGAQPGELGLAGLGRLAAPSGGARPPAPWRPRRPSGGARTRRRRGSAWFRAGPDRTRSRRARRASAPGCACACARP